MSVEMSVMPESLPALPREDAEKTRPYVQFDGHLGQAIVERVAAGETLQAICETPGMPASRTVRRWARRNSDFARELVLAKKASHRPMRGGLPGFAAEVADEILVRLTDGEPLSRLGDDPALPSLSTIYAWAATHPEFADALDRARDARADRLADMGWRMALNARREDARLLSVQLAHLRWMDGRRARRNEPPARPAPNAAPYAAQEAAVAVQVRTIEVEAQSGRMRTLTFRTDPETPTISRPSPLAGEGGRRSRPDEGSSDLSEEADASIADIAARPLIRAAGAAHLLPQGEKDSAGPPRRCVSTGAELPYSRRSAPRPA